MPNSGYILGMLWDKPYVYEITTLSIPAAISGIFYSAQISGRPDNAEFSIESQSDGWLTITGDGLLTGTPPSIISSSQVTVVAKWENGQIVRKRTYNIVIYPALEITTDSLEQAHALIYYQDRVHTNKPADIEITGIPDGLVGLSTGVISGVPTHNAVGTHTLTVTASNLYETVTKDLTLEVDIPYFEITTLRIPNPHFEIPYSVNIRTNLPADSFSVVVSPEISDIAITDDGILTFSQTRPNTEYKVLVTATYDYQGEVFVAEEEYDLFSDDKVYITTTSLPDGEIGSPYVAKIDTTGPAYMSGTFVPSTLTIDSNGQITGNITDDITSAQITATDGLGRTDVKDFIINSTAPFTFLTADKLPVGVAGSVYATILRTNKAMASSKITAQTGTSEFRLQAGISDTQVYLICENLKNETTTVTVEATSLTNEVTSKKFTVPISTTLVPTYVVDNEKGVYNVSEISKQGDAILLKMRVQIGHFELANPASIEFNCGTSKASVYGNGFPAGLSVGWGIELEDGTNIYNNSFIAPTATGDMGLGQSASIAFPNKTTMTVQTDILDKPLYLYTLCRDTDAIKTIYGFELGFSMRAGGSTQSLSIQTAVLPDKLLDYTKVKAESMKTFQSVSYDSTADTTDIVSIGPIFIKTSATGTLGWTMLGSTAGTSGVQYNVSPVQLWVDDFFVDYKNTTLMFVGGIEGNFKFDTYDTPLDRTIWDTTTLKTYWTVSPEDWNQDNVTFYNYKFK